MFRRPVTVTTAMPKASERLRALEGAIRVEPVPSVVPADNVLFAALPLIIEVVEAAEKAHDEPYESDIWWRAMGEHLTALNAALEAGDE